MKTFKKMWRYVKRYKALLITSLVMMLISQGLSFTSPLIVKQILDNELNGIQAPWYEVSTSNSHTVYYNGAYYEQGKYLPSSEQNAQEASIIMYGMKFYFADTAVADGDRTISGSTLTVTSGSNSYTYPVTQLSYHEVLDFYAPIVPSLEVFVLMLFAISICSIIVNFIQRLSSANINVNITRDARLDAVKKLESMPISYFESEPAGKLAGRIITDVNGLMNLFGTLMNLVVNATMSFIFAYIGMFYLDYKMALLSFVIYPFIYIWLRFFIKKVHKVASKVDEQNSLITASVNEIINGISILQIFNYKKQTAERFDSLSKDFMRNQLTEVKLHTTLGWNMIGFLQGLITAFIVLYFGSIYLNSPGILITAGLIYAYNTYLLKIIGPVSALFNQLSTLQHSMVRTERIFKIIDAETEPYDKTVIPRYKGDIHFNDVWFAYNGTDYVLKGINLDIQAGQLIGIVGHTGSGKSSLMSLLLRFYDLKPTDKGQITVDETDINTISKRTYRQHIGIILQDPVLFKGTIASNVRFGKESLTDEDVEEVLVKIGAKKLIDKYPEGINAKVTRGGANFSVGEKQLISFARALVYDPSILVMDEATANIDTETEEMIQNALNVVSRNRTVIIIAHRLSTIKNADKIVVLYNGRKLEEGSHDELLINNGVYAEIYRSQVKL